MLRAGPGIRPARRNQKKLFASHERLCSFEDQDRMKKIALVFCLLALCAAAGHAQESRQDVSLSGFGLIAPFVASSTDVQVHSNYALGALASYRFMLTPSSALEVNYGVTYENTYRYIVSNTNNYNILTRTQEISAAYVHSFTYKKFNPFVEAGPAALIFLPIRNSGTTNIDAKQQTEIAALYGAGIAYEISPSFDIRAEYRAWVTKVPNFGLGGGSATTNLTTNKWFNIYVPALGVAYHF
jgi:outer membrane immunogenic protein